MSSRVGWLSLETVESYSKWSNMLQLAFGLLSILAYVTVLVIQTRFFPIQARTLSGFLPLSSLSF